MDSTAAQQITKKPRTEDGDDVAEIAPIAEDDFCSDLLEASCAPHSSTAHLARAEERLAARDYDGAVRAANAVLADLPSLPAIARAALLRGRAIVDKAAQESDGQADDGVYEKAPAGPPRRARPRGRRRPARRGRPRGRGGLQRRRRRAHAHRRLQPRQVPRPDRRARRRGGRDLPPLAARNAIHIPELQPAGVDRLLRPQRDRARLVAGVLAAQRAPQRARVRVVPGGHRENQRAASEAVDRGGFHECIRSGAYAPLPLFAVDVSTKSQKDDEASMKETIFAHYIVWAAGEFQYPNMTKPVSKTTMETETSEEKKDEELEDTELPALPGSEHCRHNSQVESWAKLEGDDFIVIGGYESGVDAAVNLARAGQRCRVLASTPCWDVKTADPSSELAPYTAARLREVTAPGFGPAPRLYAPLRVVKVEKARGGGFDVTAEWQSVEEAEEAPLREPVAVTHDEPGAPGSTLVLHTPVAPILATGFQGSVRAAAGHLFAFADDDHPQKGCLGDAPLLTRDDESTIVPGVFLVGPQVQHDALSFCFVYKFRQRFAVVANAICRGLGIDTRAAVAACRSHNMYLDNFQGCKDTCGDVC